MKESNVLKKVLKDRHQSMKLMRDQSGLFRSPTGDERIKVGFTGRSDTSGPMTVTITPEMVGKKIAIATFVETKRLKGGRLSDPQKYFLEDMTRRGAFACFVRSLEELEQKRLEFMAWLTS